MEGAISELIAMIVEIPTGSRNKYETDKATGRIFLDRLLFTSTHYPADYGYVPETIAEDGDPLDAMALVMEPTFPGCMIRIRPIGIFLMEDQGLPDHKVIGVPWGDYRYDAYADVADLPAHQRLELEHFFTVYKQLEAKKTAALGWRPVTEVPAVVAAARARYPGSR